MAGLPVPPDKKDDELVEPKAITGHGPQGSKYGRGRMGPDGLSPQDKARLHFYVRYVRRMTHEDRPDIDAHIP